MAKRKFYGGDYAGIDSRRAMENRDANMIPSARGIANMPQALVMKQYPNTVYNGFEGLNDTMRGIETQMRDDLKMKKSGKFPTKY